MNYTKLFKGFTLAVGCVLFLASCFLFGFSDTITSILFLVIAIMFFGTICLVVWLIIEDIIWGVDGPPLSKTLNKWALQREDRKHSYNKAKIVDHEVSSQT